jgi:hypothetical protein
MFLGLFLLMAPEPPFEVGSAQPLPALTQRFYHTEGWTGSDAAYSIPLGDGRLLWLFGDTWIGKIEGGKRVGPRMINNSAAIQSLKDDKTPFRFFWHAGEKPLALFRPPREGNWYWPGDGAVVEGRLHLFCRVLKRKADGPPGFQFDWFGNDLLRIDNPADEPTAWKFDRFSLPQGENDLRPGVACLVEGDHLYSYGLFPAKACRAFHTPLAVARIHRKKLAAGDLTAWEYWCKSADGERWSQRLSDPVPLFTDSATEMSIGRVPGIPGLIATYTSLGLGGDIVVRHAERPEGPWSKPLRVYRCPEAGGKLLLYAAKAHSALSQRDGQMIITYCRNTGSLAEHVKQPDIYFPQAVEVQLRRRVAP